MKHRFRWFYLLPVVCGTLGLTLPAHAGEPFRFPEGKQGKGELRFHHGIPVLQVEGTPQEIGAQVGKLAVEPSKRVLNYPQELLRYLTTPVGVNLLWPIVVKKGNRLLENFPGDYRAEFEAIAKAGGIDRQRLMVGNTIFDLKQDLASLFGCSALIVEAERSPTGKPIFGRNMDYISLGYLHEYSLVTIYRPKGKRAFAGIGYAGLVGCLSGMNDAGLALTILETTGAPASEGPVFNQEGTPFLLCYRRLLEECTTVQEAEKLLKNMKRTTTNNLALCDRNGGAIFEITPSRVIVRRSENGIGTCTNHFCSHELKLPQAKNLFATLDRMAILERVRPGHEKIGVEDVHHYLDAVNQGELTLQTMIFEPASLKLHLAVAVGSDPASGQKLKHFDLAPFLKNEQAQSGGRDKGAGLKKLPGP